MRLLAKEVMIYLKMYVMLNFMVFRKTGLGVGLFIYLNKQYMYAKRWLRNCF